MTNKRSRLSIPHSLEKSDDLQVIRGIGPALAKRLNSAGIQTYAQLAAMSPKKLALQVNEFSVKQITRQDWIGQARKLVRREMSPKPHKKETATPTVRQHYQNFTVEFLLDENHILRRMRVVHIQSRDADTWSTWESEQLIDFLARHIGVQNQDTTSIYIRKLHSSSPASKNETEKVVSTDVITSDQVSKFPTGPLLESQSSQVTEFSPHVIHLAGILQLFDLKVVPIDTDQPISSLRQNQPYRVQVGLDLSKVMVPKNIPLNYRTIMSFKELGGSRYPIGEVNHIIKLDDDEIVNMIGPRLHPGIYRLDASVSLTTENETSALTASLKGELIPVY